MTPILTPKSAALFADGWIQAWNTRDLGRIIGHYADDIVFMSPFVGRLMDGVSDKVRGLEALRIYFVMALNAYPDLRFVLQRTYCGGQSVVLEYQSVSNLLAAEVMEFNDLGLVCRARVHYAAAEASAFI